MDGEPTIGELLEDGARALWYEDDLRTGREHFEATYRLAQRENDPQPAASAVLGLSALWAQELDFTAAEMSGCSFRGVDFRSVRLPHDDALTIVHTTELVDQALEDLSRRSGEAGAPIAVQILKNARKWLPTLFNLRDFPSAAPLVAEVLQAHG